MIKCPWPGSLQLRCFTKDEGVPGVIESPVIPRRERGHMPAGNHTMVTHATALMVVCFSEKQCMLACWRRRVAPMSATDRRD